MLRSMLMITDTPSIEDTGQDISHCELASWVPGHEAHFVAFSHLICITSLLDLELLL